MAKWVLETADRSNASPMPYPILKEQGRYPSIINYDTSGLDDYSEEHRNEGLKTGTLSVTISGVGANAPGGATVDTTPFSLVRTDKDFAHFNFNYDKVQLPYYNDVGTKNYTDNKVVTGWKIVDMSKSAGSITAGSDATATVNLDGDITLSTPYNFADRNCTAKDIYSNTNKRV